jgi:hypothetical protein
MRNALITIGLLVLVMAVLASGQEVSTSQPAPANQVERLLDAESANYNAAQAYKQEDWKSAAKYSDQVARLLQDAVAAESKDTVASR